MSSRPWLPGAAEGEAEVPAALSAQLCSYLTIIMVFICHLREENPAVCKQGICSTGCFCLALSIVLHNTVCGSYAAHPGGFAVVLATVDPRATRDREQVPPLSDFVFTKTAAVSHRITVTHQTSYYVQLKSARKDVTHRHTYAPLPSDPGTLELRMQKVFSQWKKMTDSCTSCTARIFCY